MILRESPASRATEGVVRVYRVAHFPLQDVPAPAEKQYTPRPEHCLQFFVRDGEIALYPDGRRCQARCVLTGFHDVTIRRVVSKDFLIVQAALEPAALHHLTGIPGTELRNSYLDATTVLGPAIARVNERLYEAESYIGMVAIVDDFIARLARQVYVPRKFDRALRLLRDASNVSIEWLARQSSLGQRQFERRCRALTGASPKLLARIGRFDRAFNTKFVYPERDWLTVAIDCGYFDYQHMVRDFKDFTGQTPPQALAAQSTAPERLLGIPQQFNVTDPDALAARLRERKPGERVRRFDLFDVPRRPSTEGW